MVLVGVVMGSKSDAEAMQPTLDILKEMGIEHEVNVISAHRTPDKARQYGQTARQRGLEGVSVRVRGPSAGRHRESPRGPLSLPRDGLVR